MSDVLADRGDEPVRRENVFKRIGAAAGLLLDAARRRRSGRIALWSLVLALALAGVALLAYPFATDLWANRIQSGLEQQFQELDPQEAQILFEERKVGAGEALTRLIIPKIGVNTIVVEGVNDEALRAGAGHYPHTALPGEPGNVGIAGHRTGYGRPFNRVNLLKKGDKIYLETPFARYIYEVTGPFDGHGNPWVTHPKDWSVVQPTVEPSLTLTTCHPPGSARERLIVRAVLAGSEPLG